LKAELKQESWTDAPEARSGDLPSAPPREGRRLVELSAYLIREDQSIVDVKVMDLSYDGCSVRTLFPLACGEKVNLSVLGRGAVKAVVRWYDSRKAGLFFPPEPRVRKHSPRKAERISVEAEISLRRSGRIAYRVDLFDLTRFGCSCEFIERPAIGERLWVRFDRLESLEAVTCWVEESRVGLKFENSVHPAVFDMLLSGLKAAAEAR
jgi:hypothetical protein